MNHFLSHVLPGFYLLRFWKCNSQTTSYLRQCYKLDILHKILDFYKNTYMFLQNKNGIYETCICQQSFQLNWQQRRANLLEWQQTRVNKKSRFGGTSFQTWKMTSSAYSYDVFCKSFYDEHLESRSNETFFYKLWEKWSRSAPRIVLGNIKHFKELIFALSPAILNKSCFWHEILSKIFQILIASIKG